MATKGSSDFHMDYMDVTQHWHPQSQKYAGGDHLLTALYNDWQMDETIFREEHWFAGMRHVVVYHFDLSRDDETMVMPVISTPLVTRIIRDSDIHVRSIEERRRGREKTATQD